MYATVLVALDGSREGAASLPHALDLARRLAARIVLLRVIPDVRTDELNHVSGEPVDRRSRRSQAEGYLDGLRRILLKEGVPTDTLVAEGPASREILKAAANLTNSIVVLTATGKGKRATDTSCLGNTARQVLAGASVPVLLVRAPAAAAATQA